MAVVALCSLSTVAGAQVRLYERDVVIPTYELGPAEPNPIFYFGRASQGAEGRVYPYPLYDRLTNKKVDRVYRMVYLENEYIRIGILPEVGGRVFEAVDKTNGYNFLYRQHVIKPALIGLIGAWISGGLEWNIPHHHRATSTLPVQYKTVHNDDGSATVWVGELELRHRMRWAVGYTIRPGTCVLEASVRIINRTPVANSMLCFANAAIHVNDAYQVIFPPGTQFVTHHAKREFTTWPIATSRYGGADFGSGTDISWYKNHWSANSMFAWNYEDDFLAGYDHLAQAGTMIVANHHIVPGKKLWTWGTGPRGRMWERILTDEDGPYMELMVGAYCDNQPDYSWLGPYETKQATFYWYPFRAIGGVKNANLEAAVNLDVNDRTAMLAFYTTRFHRKALVRLELAGRSLMQEIVTISPGRPYAKRVDLPEDVNKHALKASISVHGRELVAYSPARTERLPMPRPVEPPPAPDQIETIEGLYLTGLRIEQFHNPAFEPDPYWQQALRRDPCDIRTNTAVAINYIKKARFFDAQTHLQRAIQRSTDRYTTPKDAEPFYYYGLALKIQGKLAQAYDVLYRATWDVRWQGPAFYTLAQIACIRKDWPDALSLLDCCLEAGALNTRAINLKAAVLRHMGKRKEAVAVVQLAERIDPLDTTGMMERWLAQHKSLLAKQIERTFRDHPATALETAMDYANAGLWEDANATLTLATKAAGQGASPLVYYYLADLAMRQGNVTTARRYRAEAMQQPAGYVFPFQYEAIQILEEAIQANPNDAKAQYYLGNLLFDWQPQRAIHYWQRSASLDPTFSIVHRNLAIAYAHQGGSDSIQKAIGSLEAAVRSYPRYAMHLAELDELYQMAGTDPNKRLAILEANQDVVMQRDDATSRLVELLVFVGRYDKAIGLMMARPFAVWEGGSLTVADTWVNAHILRARRLLDQGQYERALADLTSAANVPDNLPSESRGANSQTAEIDYWKGLIYQAMGDPDRAMLAWQQAGRTLSGGRRANAIGPDAYWQAMALLKLGQKDQADSILGQLIAVGKQRLDSPKTGEFFESFGRQLPQRFRQAQAHYLVGLGYLGVGESEKGMHHLRAALEARPDHLGAKVALGG